MHTNCVILCFVAEDFDPLGITSEETRCVLFYLLCYTNTWVHGISRQSEAHTCTVRKGILKERTSLSKVFVTFTSNVSQNLEKNINQTLSSHRHLGLWFG